MTRACEVAAAAERWEEQYRNLCEDDRESTLLDAYKVTALKLVLCGEVQKAVEHREQEFRTYQERPSVVVKRAINRQIQNERTQHDRMDCSHVPWNSTPNPGWNMPEEWKAATDAAWASTNLEANAESPTDVDCAH